jgi:hypothetical protein
MPMMNSSNSVERRPEGSIRGTGETVCRGGVLRRAAAVAAGMDDQRPAAFQGIPSLSFADQVQRRDRRAAGADACAVRIGSTMYFVSLGSMPRSSR